MQENKNYCKWHRVPLLPEFYNRHQQYDAAVLRIHTPSSDYIWENENMLSYTDSINVKLDLNERWKLLRWLRPAGTNAVRESNREASKHFRLKLWLQRRSTKNDSLFFEPEFLSKSAYRVYANVNIVSMVPEDETSSTQTHLTFGTNSSLESKLLQNHWRSSHMKRRARSLLLSQTKRKNRRISQWNTWEPASAAKALNTWDFWEIVIPRSSWRLVDQLL